MARKVQADTIPFSPKPKDVQNMLGRIKAKFLDRYPRVERTNQVVEMAKEEATYYPPMPGYQLFKLVPPPVSGYVEVARIRLNDLVATNELLCYRILKHTYGAPDITVASLNLEKKGYVPLEWGYCLRIHEAALVEVLRISHSIFLVVWGREGSPKAVREQCAAAFKRFLDDISEALRRGKALSPGKSERKQALIAGAGVPNPSVEKYAAALELMRLAKTADQPRDWKRFRWGEPIDHPLTGSVYLAAIMFLYTSLEAFEQLVRDHLLKANCQTEEELEKIRKLSLKERIAKLDEFCNGFRESPAPKDGPLYKKLGMLSRVRNEALHGNIPADVNIYGLSEDGFVFMYSPEQDDEDKAWTGDYVPFTRGSVRRRHAEHVKSLVDETISAVTASMTPEYVEIGNRFRTESVLSKDPEGRIGFPPKL